MYAAGSAVFALASFCVWKTMPPIPADLVNFASVSLGMNVLLALCLHLVIIRSLRHPKPAPVIWARIKGFLNRLGVPFAVGVVYTVIATIGFTFCMESFSAGIAGGIVACGMYSYVNRQFPQDNPATHPYYGPCDANAPGRRCAECEKIHDMEKGHA